MAQPEKTEPLPVCLDADVLIAYLSRDDANHREAVERMRRALASGTRRLVSAVNYTEVLIGPLLKEGVPGAEIVDAMLVRGYCRSRARAYSTASGAMDSTTIARITNAKFSRTAGIPPNR